MNLTTLANHSGLILDAGAAASLARFERDHGVITITSAYRSIATQQTYIDRWNAGGTQNRPPYLFKPAMPATASRHTLGIALDTSGNGIELMHKYGQAYGWFFNFAYDLVHFEYEANRDTHVGSAPAPAKGTRPTIRQGSTGQAVKDLQTILVKYHGAKLTVDGVFGKRTAKYVSAFQKKYGLSFDGIVGPATWRKLGQ